MSEAPERIWAGNWLADVGETVTWDMGEWRNEPWPTVDVVEYVRADLVQAAVAAALREAAEHIRGHAYVTSGDHRALEPVRSSLRGMDQHHETISQAVLALLPDAGAALDRVVAERTEALEAKLEKAVEEMKKVDEYLTRLQRPYTEPLNSVNGCNNKKGRSQYTAMVRNEAREYWASLGNTLAELTGGKDE